METRQMADEPIDLTANPIAENSQPQTENEEVNTSAVAADAATDETKAPEAASAIDEMSEADVIITLTSLAQAEADEISRDEVSRLKQRYYALRKAADERPAASSLPTEMIRRLLFPKKIRPTRCFVSCFAR